MPGLGSLSTGLGNVQTAGEQPGGVGGGGGGITSIVAGAGISVTTVAGVATITNTAGFTADTTVQLNNTTPAPVNAWRSLIALSTATPGAENSTWTISLLRTGAAFTVAYFDSSGWWGVGTSTVNLGANAAGTRGITITGTSTNAGIIELKKTTTSASSQAIGAIDAYNGANKVSIIQFHNVSSTTNGQIRFFVGVGLTLVMSLLDTAISLSVNISSTGATNSFSGTMLLNANAAQSLSKTGGTLEFGTTDNNGINVRANNVTRIAIAASGNIGFFGVAAVAQQTIGANVNNVVASGTTGQFDDFTDLVVYANDAAAIHADISQLARSVTQLTTATRNLGLGA